MNPASHELRNLAERLIAFENKTDNSSTAILPRVCLVVEKVRPHLSALMGVMGFSALATRALMLATADIPWLRQVHVKADGALDGFAELSSQIDKDKFLQACVAYLTHLFGLLEVFIGEKLTLQLIYDVWPELSHSDAHFNKGEKK